MLISVTQLDINSGIPQDCECCPIGLAIQRNFPGAPISVSQDCIVIGTIKFSLTTQMILFIDAFDDDCPVEPFEFELKELDNR